MPSVLELLDEQIKLLQEKISKLPVGIQEELVSLILAERTRIKFEKGGKMSAKIMFNIGAEIEGTLSTRKMDELAETLADTLESVALPVQELKIVDKQYDTYKSWHEHDPAEDACRECRKQGTVQLPFEEE